MFDGSLYTNVREIWKTTLGYSESVRIWWCFLRMYITLGSVFGYVVVELAVLFLDGTLGGSRVAYPSVEPALLIVLFIKSQLCCSFFFIG